MFKYEVNFSSLVSYWLSFAVEVLMLKPAKCLIQKLLCSVRSFMKSIVKFVIRKMALAKTQFLGVYAIQTTSQPWL